MRRETIRESQAAPIDLSDAQARALARAGRELAGRAGWWGEDEEEQTSEGEPRSVIRVSPAGGDRWSIRVSDAVGLIAVGDLQLLVEPKIPVDHLLYLFERARSVPRTAEERAAAAEGRNFWELIAEWYMREVEALLRRDLIRDYHLEGDRLKVVRGRITPLATARAFYSGRLEIDCEYEEFGIDTPLNRMLRAAARAVAGSPVLGRRLRRRAMAILARTVGVGELDHSDLRAQLDRRTGHYRDAIALARSILSGVSRFLAHGESVAWTFLIRTPEMVEKGIRSILENAFAGQHQIQKRGRQLLESTMTLNPDIVVDDGLAVADVKYRVSGPDWRRADLYQIVAFAEGFGSQFGAIVDFGVAREQRGVVVGTKMIEHIPWGIACSPIDAESQLLQAFAHWVGRAQSQRAA